ncbi:MAG: aminoacyl--tRNA ligase-related protein [FCB group bacterium]|jgi:seryl-tRNA synthetase|nr:aminoacyl--tRNA ligase-related protein [FCB group bacterium]
MGTITLEFPVARDNQDELLRSLQWAAPEVASLAFDPADGRVIHYGQAERTAPDESGVRLKEAADRLARSFHLAPAKKAYVGGPPRVPGLRSPYEQLVRRGWVRPVAAGAHVYCGLMSELFFALDAEFRRQALLLDPAVEEQKFPTLVELQTLRTAGYLAGFPHHVNFLSHLPEQKDAVERFQSRTAAAGAASVALDGVGACAAHAMCPTVCYQFFTANAGRVIAPESLLGATALSSCFRFEGRHTTGLRRLREFTMREVMFLGPADAVQARRARLMELMVRMLELCGLRSELVTASDPFFIDVADKKRLFQMSFDLKYEARAHVPDDDSWLAVGSVNDHQEHFGRSFDIKLQDGEAARSCCLGFGLDRWCLAVFAQYGLEVEEWPAGLREIVRKRRSDAGGTREEKRA